MGEAVRNGTGIEQGCILETELSELFEAAELVTKYDWSDNDQDSVVAMKRLTAVVTRLHPL